MKLRFILLIEMKKSLFQIHSSAVHRLVKVLCLSTSINRIVVSAFQPKMTNNTNYELYHQYSKQRNELDIVVSLKRESFFFVEVICGVTHCQYSMSSGGLVCFDIVAFMANGVLLRS
jgi:hypothetical protein